MHLLINIYMYHTLFVTLLLNYQNNWHLDMFLEYTET